LEETRRAEEGVWSGKTAGRVARKMIVWFPAGTRDKHRPSKSDAPGESMCSPGGIVGTRVKSREKLRSEVT
jgi:hypothetical protein